jgi:hypothetical protein
MSTTFYTCAVFGEVGASEELEWHARREHHKLHLCDHRVGYLDSFSIHPLIAKYEANEIHE